mgnify:CR=1 FL=1
MLDAHGQFQLLCALRRGPWGVEGLNARIAGWLRDAGLIPAADGWYAGRPVLVTRNDYALGLKDNFVKVFESKGGTIVAEETYTKSDKDYRAQLNKIKASGADVLYVPNYT